MADVSASFEIQGLDELDATLRQLGHEVAGPIMQAALEEAGEVIRRAAAANIHSRSGRTAADLRVEVQVSPTHDVSAVATIGGTAKGKGGRVHVLRWLEFGTRPHTITAGSTARKDARKAARALTRIGDTGAARALRAGVRSGKIRVAKALALPGGSFRFAVKHPGTANQSPLTRALADHGEQAVKTLAAALWSGIRAFALSRAGRGG